MAEILRTPDNCFENLCGYAFEPHYLTIPDKSLGRLRMHYLDEGVGDNGTILLLHGQGTWSYLYRNMIPILVEAGFRVLAPDFIGFGRSDKPVAPEAHTLANHSEWLMEFMRATGASPVYGFCFDWGAFFAMRLVKAAPQLFSKLIFINSPPPLPEAAASDWIIQWRQQLYELPAFPMGEMVQEFSLRRLSQAEVEAYDAPYPNESYKIAPRTFPMMHPVLMDCPETETNQQAWDAMVRWEKPVLTLYSDLFADTAVPIQQQVQGARHQRHRVFAKSGFFLPEDKAVELARETTAFAGS